MTYWLEKIEMSKDREAIISKVLPILEGANDRTDLEPTPFNKLRPLIDQRCSEDPRVSETPQHAYCK